MMILLYCMMRTSRQITNLQQSSMGLTRLSIATIISTLSRPTLTRGSPNLFGFGRRCSLISTTRCISSSKSVTRMVIRGGGSDEESSDNNDVVKRNFSSDPKFVKLADPAPGSPFHLAMPVHDLDIAKDFYGNILGCEEGRSSEKWQDFSLHGHQIVCHWVGSDYRCQDYFNPVDGDEVPVPHFGLALTEDEFHTLAQRLTDAGIEFIIQPHLRFKGQPGEQWTMFFKDPSGNNLEFKSMTTIDNLFAKYNVVDK